MLQGKSVVACLGQHTSMWVGGDIRGAQQQESEHHGTAFLANTKT
jgi:hypothetical protein